MTKLLSVLLLFVVSFVFLGFSFAVSKDFIRSVVYKERARFIIEEFFLMVILFAAASLSLFGIFFLLG